MNRPDVSSRRLSPAWQAAVVSALVYVGATLVIGRGVLQNLAGRVLNDPGDPLLNAAILDWNSMHLPLTHAWWQFPIFFPTPDVITFSEHLLGLSVLATPLEWLSGNPLVAYNLVALLTFPLCAMAMYALVYRLTRSAAGAFVAGVAFGFAPYRVAQLAHVQMLATFYAPLALLGLHEYLLNGRRRWLGLYGVCWLLQGAANGYLLFYFSLFVGILGVWFVIARRRWRAAAEITAATLLAAVPLAPVLYRYLIVHQFQGLVRSASEMRTFSPDVAGLFCAAPSLSFWGWLHVACRPEGELFPGLVTFLLFVGGAVGVLGWPGDRSGPTASRRALLIAARVAALVGLVYIGCVVAIAMTGGAVTLDLGPLHASASNMPRSALIAVAALLVAFLLGALARGDADTPPHPMPFYVTAAIVTWVLALGPSIIVMGQTKGYSGPFSWLLALPGTDGLRVPGRFWMLTVLCLAVTAGLVVAALVERRRRGVAIVSAAIIGCAVFSDGAVGVLRSAPMPTLLSDARTLAGTRALLLPITPESDTLFTYDAVVGGGRAVNGYSGYEPTYYPALMAATRMEDPALFEPFQRYGTLDVVVMNTAPRLRAAVEHVAGAVMVAHDDAITRYRLPPKPAAPATAAGRVVPIARVRADCASEIEDRALDHSLDSTWMCPQTRDGTFTIDVGQPTRVSQVVTEMGQYVVDYPNALTVETSIDGGRWEPAWTGSGLAPLVWSAIEQPTRVPSTIAFTPRMARFIRLRQTGRDSLHGWAIPEVQVRAQ